MRRVQQVELSHAAECPGEGGLGVRTAPPLRAGQGRERHAQGGASHVVRMLHSFFPTWNAHSKEVP